MLPQQQDHDQRAMSKLIPRNTFTGKIFARSACLILASMLGLADMQTAWGQQEPWSQRAAESAMKQWPATEGKAISKSELATLLNGVDAAWYNTANGSYYQYAKQTVDRLIESDGSTLAPTAHTNLPNEVALGRPLLLLYRATQEEKYYKAALLLRRQLSSQTGGDASSSNRTYQMQVDDLYAVEPFYAEYASIFQEPQDFANITRPFTSAEEHLRPSKTNALIRARDAGRYMMALIDTLPYYPANDPGRAELLTLLNRTAAFVVKLQDSDTDIWLQVLGTLQKKGNGLDPKATCMFVYALQKGVRLGYLPQSYSGSATRAWRGLLSHSVQDDASGFMTVTGTNKDAAAINNPEEAGFFLLAGTEMDLAPEADLARGQTVMIDAWFNSQQRTNAAGQKEYFHYKWDDYSFSGFSIFGHIFTSHGAALDTLYSAPTAAKLKGAQYYVIVSPDIPVKNPHPNYVQAEDAGQVAEWVKQGGVLILMENDPANADIDHLNLIADRFGIHFNDVLSHHVVGDDFPAGQIAMDGSGPVFHHPHMLYMKDTCTISPQSPAEALLKDKGDIMMASARYGRGFVFAVVDPWLYNEYTDGRKKLPLHDNYAAGKELVLWLIKQQSNSGIHARR